MGPDWSSLALRRDRHLGVQFAMKHEKSSGCLPLLGEEQSAHSRAAPHQTIEPPCCIQTEFPSYQDSQSTCKDKQTTGCFSFHLVFRPHSTQPGQNPEPFTMAGSRGSGIFLPPNLPITKHLIQNFPFYFWISPNRSLLKMLATLRWPKKR